MAIRTTSLVPFKITNIPDRFTMLYVADPTQTTTTASSASATVRLNRVQSGAFTVATGVVDVVEMGSQYRPGGVDNLGECSWNLGFNAVGIHNICALTGTAVPTANGAKVTISATNLNSSTVDFIRLVADSTGVVFASYYFQDCITEDYGVDVSESGLVSESASGKGPSGLAFPGFIIPKCYVATGTDQTNQFLAPASIFSTSEQAVQIYQAPNGEPLSYWQQNGANYFLKIEKVPLGNLANTPIRYFENGQALTQESISASSTTWVTPTAFFAKMCVVGNSIDFLSASGGAVAQTCAILAVAQQVNTTSTSAVGTTGSHTVTVSGGTGMAGIEGPGTYNGAVASNGVQVTYDTGANQEVVVVTATAGSTFTAVFAKTHAATVPVVTAAPSILITNVALVNAAIPFCAHLSAAQNYYGQATYNATSGKFLFGDSITTTDLFRLVFCTYNTDTSLPLVVPNNGDPTDVAGVPSRMIPFSINTLNAKRLQKASMKMSLKRGHVQGIGENAIIYGVSSVPDVAVDLDAKETDLSLLSLIQTGSQNLTSQGGTIQNDTEDLNYLTRITLDPANAVPVSINLYNPFNAAAVLATWSTPQFIPTSIGFSSSNKSDNTVKITGMDITGNMVVTYQVPF